MKAKKKKIKKIVATTSYEAKAIKRGMGTNPMFKI